MNIKRFTEAEERGICRLYQGHDEVIPLGLKKIAKDLNTNHITIRNVLLRHGVELRQGHVKRRNRIKIKCDVIPKELWDKLVLIDFTEDSVRHREHGKKVNHDIDIRMGVIIDVKTGTRYFKEYFARTRNPTKAQILNLINVAYRLYPNKRVASDKEFKKYDERVLAIKPYSKLFQLKENFGVYKAIAYLLKVPCYKVFREYMKRVE